MIRRSAFAVQFPSDEHQRYVPPGKLVLLAWLVLS